MTSINEPLVSIAMPVFNGAKTLEATLQSLQNQTHRNWELLLIDDGSSDATPSILRRENDPRIRIVIDGDRRGHGSRLNQAIEMAKGRYLARMDQDDICFPDRLLRQVHSLEKNPMIDLLATRALVFSDDGTIKGLFPFRQTHADICRRPSGGFYLPHPTWMGKIEWFKKFRYGGDEVIRAEDQDLLLRSYRTSTFACLDEVLLGYRQNELPLKSVLTGRRSFRRAVVREAMRHGRYGDIPLVTLEQLAKGILERTIAKLGLQNSLLRHRASPVADLRLSKHWQEVWRQCTRDSRAV